MRYTCPWVRVTVKHTPFRVYNVLLLGRLIDRLAHLERKVEHDEDEGEQRGAFERRGRRLAEPTIELADDGGGGGRRRCRQIRLLLAADRRWLGPGTFLIMVIVVVVVLGAISTAGRDGHWCGD